MQVRPQNGSLLGDVFFAFAKGADTPVSLACWLMFKYGEHKQLAEKNIDPTHYNSLHDFRRDYAVVKFLSKYKGLDTGIDIDREALNSWRASESRNFETNRRLKHGAVRGFSPRVEAVIFTARRKIGQCLGNYSLSKAMDGCKWGPGATFSLKGWYSTLDDKIREFPISVTQKALPLLKWQIESDPHWCSALLGIDVEGPISLLPCNFKIVRGCRGTLAEKNAKTKRTIAIEPTGNIFLQLGFGRFIRRCLKRFGVDLDTQEYNQILAWLGSIYDIIATLDVKDASNSLCTELVYLLLPLDIAMMLDAIRSPEITWDKSKTWTRLEMFSSMGNGFTFELESLIFWGLASACAEVLGQREAVGIFGDDIAISRDAVPLLTEVLEVCGFGLNKSKSYDVGPFRESCGKHYWNGSEVTPIYQKELLASLPEAYRLSNRLRRYANWRADESKGRWCASWVRPAWLASLRGVLRFLRRSTVNDDKYPSNVSSTIDTIARWGGHAIPFGDESDDGLMLTESELTPFILECYQHGAQVERLKLPVLSFRPKKKNFDGRSQLAYLLRFGSDEPFKGRIAIRRRGKWVTRRRWFTVGVFTPRSALNVAWQGE